MSIVRDTNFNGKTSKDIEDAHTYLTDSLKTGGGKYVAGLGFITEKYLAEFQGVKITNQKTGGRQFRQITIAPSPVGNKLSNAEYMEMGKEIAQHYYDLGFQVIVTLHLDTDTPHIHLMVNSVNYKTGLKFSQSKKELNRFKVHCNHVFTKYGLDPIGSSIDAMIDTVVHEMSEGFTCLELFDEIMADKASIFNDLSTEEPSLPKNDRITVKYVDNNSRKSPDYPVYRSSNSFGFNQYNSYPQASYSGSSFQEEKIMNNYNNTPQVMPAAVNPQLPELTPNNNIPAVSYNSTTPCVTLDNSRNINLEVPDNCNPQELSSLINNIQPMSDAEKTFNAKLGVAATAELNRYGYQIPVYVDNSTNINVSYNFPPRNEESIVDLHALPNFPLFY